MKNILKSIFFAVTKVPSIDLFKNTAMEYNSENAYAIVGGWPEEKREKVLNFCSSIYKLIENRSILEPLIPVLEKKFKHIKINVTNEKDAQFTVRISPVVPSFSPKTEVIQPAIFFVNSYDGKILAQAIGGLVRYMVDEKGNVFESESTYMKGLSFVYTFKHSNEEIYSMLEISDKIDQYLKDFNNVKKQIKLLKAITIENATNSKLEKLVRNLAKGTVYPLKEIEETIERIEYESMVFDAEPNLWSIYNAMNYILKYSESALTKMARIGADSKIYANVCQFLSKKTDKKEKAVLA